MRTSNKTSRPRYRSPTEWLSVGMLAAATLAVIGAWGYAAWWIGSTILHWIG